MSQPDYPETVICPECHHPYAPDSLSEQQRAQANSCPWCNPVTASMSEEEETEWKILEALNASRGAA